MRALLCFAAKRLLAALLLAIFIPVIFGALSFSQSGAQHLATQDTVSLSARRPLVTEPLDESKLAVLKGNTHPLARREFDLGTAPATLPMQRMLLVLKRSPGQESALRKLLDDQQDKASPSYHKWVTPEEFGKQYGPTDADLQTITGWLQSHGFQVAPTKGRTVLEFSGSASQVRETFHTAIHKYIVNEEQHWANTNDPLIPAALTPAVAGVATLHNFLKKPQIQLVQEPATANIRPGKKPLVTFPAQNGKPATNALGPQDYATIYNINPVYAESVNGVGITIAVVGRSNLYNGGQDVNDFRNVFGLCCGSYNIDVNGPDPGDLGGGEEAEATLDMSWSSALASGANVDLVVSATTNTTDGVDLSEVYIVENNLADVMTESFGACELYATDAQLAFTYGLAEQAAAQGITYFVSSGDNGAEACDDPAATLATNPISVNLLASTPFNTAVGGTEFNEAGQGTKYWGTEAPIQESAISYIPEDVWNESSSGGLASSSGGASAGNIQAGGTTPGIPKPSWQSGVTGIPQDGVRDLPDVSLTAAIHDPYLVCLEGSCTPDSTGRIYIYFAGGTSASAPSFASIMALVDQHMVNLNPAQGRRQGQANYILYRLAASQNASLAQCNASNTSVLPATTCIFNDVTFGNNAVPGELSYGSTNPQYAAGIGYDMATGLGSVNVANLVNQWNSVTFVPTTTTLTLSPTSITHGSPVSVTISVVPSSGTGIPSGDVSLLATTLGTIEVGGFTLDSTGAVVSSTNNIPGGGASVIAHYAGDATYAPSDSNVVSPTVLAEPSTTALSIFTLDINGNVIPFNSGPFGSSVFLKAAVAGQSGHGAPTGFVNFTDTLGSIPGTNLYSLSGGDQLNTGSTATTPPIFAFDTGTHTINAYFVGDSSFQLSGTTQGISFTIQPGFFAAIPANQAGIGITAPGGSGSTSVAVSSSTGFSGTITLACSGLPAGAACVFSPSSIKATGTATTTSSTVTVTTSSGTAATLRPSIPFGRGWLAASTLMFFSILLISAPARRRSLPFLLAIVTLILLSPGCGGGASRTPPPPPPVPATVAGTYNITVTASSGSITSATGFTLFVQ
jgi:hypothetical protein